jgi:hypothetical protein
VDRISTELSRLISEHPLDVLCTECDTCHPSTIGFVKANREMPCPWCSERILLNISSIQAEARRVEKSLLALHTQLKTTIGH